MPKKSKRNAQLEAARKIKQEQKEREDQKLHDERVLLNKQPQETPAPSNRRT